MQKIDDSEFKLPNEGHTKKAIEEKVTFKEEEFDSDQEASENY